jgi:peptide chain release factor 1
MFDEIKKIASKIDLEALEQSLSTLSAQLDQTTDFQSDSYIKTIKDYNETKALIESYKKLKELESSYNSNLEMANDPEMGELVKEDNIKIESEINTLVKDILSKIQKPLDNDDKKAIMEIRPGVGGVEASIFAEDLFRMYTRYFNVKGIKAEIISLDYNNEGGITEAVIILNSPDSFGLMRFESGIHRVQRVPKTEALGRIHTSTASVAVLPKFEAKDIHINPSDIRIDVYRSSGPGGQSVNTTDSAVRITHLPTKIIVTCQNGRSQIQNKETAMGILASKLQEIEDKKHMDAENKIRGEAIGDSDRSSKIRTYNFPQSRVTDHRIGESWFNIEGIMEGEIDEILKATNQGLREE